MNLDHLPNLKGDLYTTQSAIDEIKSHQAKILLELFIEETQLSIISPSVGYISKVEEISRSIGQIELSETDKEILALALMLKEHDEILLYSDDYGLRNVGHALGLKSKGVKTKGGKQQREFDYLCKACKSVFPSRVEECDTCGNENFIRRRRK